jgi:hypothetical protein
MHIGRRSFYFFIVRTGTFQMHTWQTCCTDSYREKLVGKLKSILLLIGMETTITECGNILIESMDPNILKTDVSKTEQLKYHHSTQKR